MSVVVAVKDGNGGVWVACDSQVTQYSTARTLSNKNNFKIFNVNNADNAIMGVVGYLRDRDILYCEDNLFDIIELTRGNIDYKYMVKKFVPNLFNVMINNHRIAKDAKTYYLEDEFIVAYKDKIYKISGDGCVIEVDDHVAIGSGQMLSRGSLVANQRDKKQMAIDAVKSACESDIFVNFPIIIMNTMSKKVDIIER